MVDNDAPSFLYKILKFGFYFLSPGIAIVINYKQLVFRKIGTKIIPYYSPLQEM